MDLEFSNLHWIISLYTEVPNKGDLCISGDYQAVYYRLAIWYTHDKTVSSLGTLVFPVVSRWFSHHKFFFRLNMYCTEKHLPWSFNYVLHNYQWFVTGKQKWFHLHSCPFYLLPCMSIIELKIITMVVIIPNIFI